MNSTGNAASTTMVVANSIGPRTSITARVITASVVCWLPSARAWRRRRAMLSTSTTASSTMTATASISPAMIIMSILPLPAVNTAAAASSAHGITSAATSAARQWPISRPSPSTTST